MAKVRVRVRARVRVRVNLQPLGKKRRHDLGGDRPRLSGGKAEVELRAPQRRLRRRYMVVP